MPCRARKLIYPVLSPLTKEHTRQRNTETTSQWKAMPRNDKCKTNQRTRQAATKANCCFRPQIVNSIIRRGHDRRRQLNLLCIPQQGEKKGAKTVFLSSFFALIVSCDLCSLAVSLPLRPPVIGPAAKGGRSKQKGEKKEERHTHKTDGE